MTKRRAVDKGTCPSVSSGQRCDQRDGHMGKHRAGTTFWTDWGADEIPQRLLVCGCPTNEAGDICCHVCGERVNIRCWLCQTPRAGGECPNPRVPAAGGTQT